MMVAPFGMQLAAAGFVWATVAALGWENPGATVAHLPFLG
jgi:hypothetical protein